MGTVNVLESTTKPVDAVFSRVPAVTILEDEDAAGADMDTGWMDAELEVIPMFIIDGGGDDGKSVVVVVVFVRGTKSGHDATWTICCCCCTATAAARAAASAPRR
jgi:hypothetical protein